MTYYMNRTWVQWMNLQKWQTPKWSSCNRTLMKKYLCHWVLLGQLLQVCKITVLIWYFFKIYFKIYFYCNLVWFWLFLRNCILYFVVCSMLNYILLFIIWTLSNEVALQLDTLYFLYFIFDFFVFLDPNELFKILTNIEDFIPKVQKEPHPRLLPVSYFCCLFNKYVFISNDVICLGHKR